MADYRRLCQEALDHMLADPKLFTDQQYWDVCNLEILCHVLGIDALPLFKEHHMEVIAPVWLGWKPSPVNGDGWVPNTEWRVCGRDESGIWGLKNVSTFPELARKLKGTRCIKVLKEVALYEMEQREALYEAGQQEKETRR